MKFKKGDKVRVWSLQSWSGGGFLEGEEAVVRQNQTGSSVILAVVRKVKGSSYELDTSYEVYAKQCELIENSKEEKDTFGYRKARKEFEKFYKNLI